MAIILFLALAAVVVIASPAWADDMSDCASCHAKYPSDSFDQYSQQNPVSLSTCWPCHGNMLKHGTALYDSPYGAFTNAASINLASPATIATIHSAHRDTVRWTSVSCVNCHRGAACGVCHGSAVPHGGHTVLSGGSNNYPGRTETYSKGTKGTVAPYTYSATLTCTNATCHGSMNTTFVARPSCLNCHGIGKDGSGHTGVPTDPEGSVQLAGGAERTAETSVSVDSSVTGANEMRFRSAGDWEDWQSYAATAVVGLSAGDGVKTVDAEYRSSSGGLLSLSDTIVLDTAPPGLVAALDPAVPDGAAGWFITTPTASLIRDEAGVTRCQWDATAPAGWTTSADPVAVVSGLAQGAHHLYSEASDVVGNASATLDTQIKLDSQAPAVPAISSSSHPDENVTYTATDASLSWSATDTVSGVAGYCVVLDANPTTIPNPAGDPLSSVESTTYSGLADGTWYVHVRAVDTAGNWGATSHRTVRIQATGGEEPVGCAVCHAKYPSDSFDQYSDTTPVSLSTCWSCHGNMLAHGTARYDTPYGSFTNAASVDITNPATIATIHSAHRDTVRWTSVSCVNCHRGAACGTCHGSSVPHGAHTTLAGGGTDYPGRTETYSKGTKGTTAPYSYTSTLTCTNASCHASMNTTFAARPSCTNCHGVAKDGHPTGFQGSHGVHLNSTNARGPGRMTCASCHDTGNYPYFKSGTDANGDGKFDRTETNVCDTCHSPNGAYNGVTSTGLSVGAKDNWADGVYSGVDLQPGKERWCIGCHDDWAAVVGTQTAANKAGDDVTYGYYITGHGRETTYAAEGWQAAADTGNPAASRSCTECHDIDSSHVGTGPASSRLRPGYENDSGNSNCKQCHDPGTMAEGAPSFYTTYAAYGNSVHASEKCSGCHDVHGTAGAHTAMTRADKSNLCGSCHSGHAGHALGTSFGKGGKTYTLQCVSCHNVHVVSGTTTTSTPSVSAMTRFVDNTEVWGDEAGEKMDDYAGGGTYRTPTGDTMNGSQLPDYDTFCLDCHATSTGEFGVHGGINWAGDNHGLVSSNVPNGGGASPNWYTFGQAAGWDGDDVVGTESEAWPVTPRGRGEQIWTRSTYNQEERIAGANFVLSCSDCHVTHEVGVAQKLRTTVNGGPGTSNWNTMCNNCHYYYSDFHAGMACGNASCHVSDRMNYAGSTPHQMSHSSGDSSTRTWNPDLVLDMRFENNLADSGAFRLDSKWFNEAGSFLAGKSGQAISLNGDQLVQVGTENANWSTDEGYHGTWKYTEMKYNTTLEAWVYPTDDTGNEYSIFTKHVGYSGGGYNFALKKIGGTLRAVLNVNVEGTSTAVRGAYSAASIPLNAWTHVAATFDTNGPDKNLGDRSVGRIRIYANGDDVTTSDGTGSNSQPGSGETNIFPYSAHSYVGDATSRDNPWGYDGHWCASEFSVGGFEWQPGFVGKMDTAKVWNVTKDGAYFTAIDQQSPPRISSATGVAGSDKLSVRFSEGVFANAGGTGALESSDFALTDFDDGRTIQAVSHSAGEPTATVTLSSELDDVGDLTVDSLAPAAGSVYDEYSNAAPSDAVTITPSGENPPGEVIFNLNETAGSAYTLDDSKLLSGKVYGSGTLTGNYFSGDGAANYVDFIYNNSALQADTTMTLEARIKPSGLSGVTGTYIRRVLGRATGGGDWQMSVWRSIDPTGWPNYTPAAGEASIAFWVRVEDPHGGQSWKPVLTEASNAASAEYHPIVSDHWYQVKVVWDTYKSGGTLSQPFVPADIYIDDQGTDGSGTGERWSGYANATDADQSQLDATRKLYTNDRIVIEDGGFRIGANTPGTGNYFNGLIDWIRWTPAAE